MIKEILRTLNAFGRAVKIRLAIGVVSLLGALSCVEGCNQKSVDTNAEGVLPTTSTGPRPNVEIQSLCFSPDGEMIVVAYKQTVKLGESARYYCELRSATGAKLLRNLGTGSKPSFSADGKLIIMGDGALLEAASGRRIRKASLYESKKAAVLSPNGKLLALATAGGFELRGKSDDQLVRPAEKSKSFMSLCFSPNGKLIAKGTFDYGKAIEMQDVATGKILWRAGIGDAYDLAFSPDGTLVATQVAVREVKTGKTVLTVRDSWYDGKWVSFSRDSKQVMFSGLSDKKDSPPVAEIWSLKSKKIIRRFACPGPAAFSPKSKALAYVAANGYTVNIIIAQ